MGLTTKTLAELLEYKDTDRLQLPEIQRDFVWNKRNVKMLFDSLYKGMPVGQMLVWKPKHAFPGKPFHGRHRRRSASTIDSFYGFLLDGQQRLTAFAQVRDGDEAYPLVFDLWPDYEDNEPDKNDPFWWDNRMTNNSPWHVPVADVLADDFDITAHLRRLEEDDLFEDRHAEVVRKSLTQLQNILEFPISVIEFESDHYKDATELFIRFNSTGKKLNKTDLVLAELALRVEDLTSKEMGKVLAKWKPHFQFTRPFLMQCLAAVHTGRMNIRSPEQVFGDSKPAEIRASWEKTARGLERVIDFITGTVRWQSGAWVSSFNALIPLVHVLADKKAFSRRESAIARRWLLLASVHGQFSGSVYTELDRILKKLSAENTVEQLWLTTPRRTRKFVADDFDTTNRSGPVMSLFISMLRDANARDWVKGTPLDGTVIGHNAQLHIHHFFPRALLAKHGFGPGYINVFANLTVIQASTNLDISMEEPATYLERLEYETTDLEKQCIPMDRKLWYVKNYEKFLEARSKLLSDSANKFIGA